VPSHQGLERRFLAALGELLQQLPVGQPAGLFGCNDRAGGAEEQARSRRHVQALAGFLDLQRT
jgi:hypothetical protein